MCGQQLGLWSERWLEEFFSHKMEQQTEQYTCKEYAKI